MCAGIQADESDSVTGSNKDKPENAPLVIENWLKGGGPTNNVVVQRIDEEPDSDLYRSLSGDTIESASTAETLLFSEDVAKILFRRSVRSLCGGAIRHFRTVIESKGLICAVFDEIRCVSAGRYLTGPVWHIEAETHPVTDTSGILMIRGRSQMGLAPIGPKESTRLELVDGPDAPPKDAKAHAFLLEVFDLTESDSANFGSVFFPIGKQFPEARPLVPETGGIGMAYLEGYSVRVVASGQTGTVSEYGPVRTDASCFFAGDRGTTMYIHFVNATTVSAFARTVVREVRLDGKVLDREAWRFAKGRVILEWPAPRTGVIAIVTSPTLLPKDE